MCSFKTVSGDRGDVEYVARQLKLDDPSFTDYRVLIVGKPSSAAIGSDNSHTRVNPVAHSSGLTVTPPRKVGVERHEFHSHRTVAEQTCTSLH